MPRSKKSRIPQPKRRNYSREFPAGAGTPHTRYLLDKIPQPFWNEVRAKCERNNVSMRTAILRCLRSWLAEEEPGSQRHLPL
jgi:hypothetical protein